MLINIWKITIVYSHNGIVLRKKKQRKWLLIYLTTWMNVKNIMLTLNLSSLRWSLKMVHYSLNPENPTKSCKKFLVFTLRTHVKLSRTLRICISEKPSIWRMSLCRSKVCHSIVTLVELVGMPRPKSGSCTQVGGPEKRAEFLLHVLQNAESNAELKDLDVDSVVMEHIQVNKTSKIWRRTYSAHNWINPYITLPATLRWFLLKKSMLFLNQKRRLHRSKRYPKRN